ncbi:GntR family transcriptional regulator [Sphingomonas sp. SFZ2018-12]|uniref:FadR/GntR family transcriptional regulator n=1 Tax=Sphingomonas sp. SFZ2018-12 TaxID=2683197 RepID=UPI001F0CE464|nr:FadR/GntR family transcriptional regulator [Sphingomonas sp. SFZ2018-12]MCH4895043.1 GntR family transcriptional regulator [Sphingomonas sp. SFZ2018-12]
MSEADASSVKLGDLVYAKIAGRIQSGEYAIDSRLPTENEFAEMLGVSRPVVREALARLRDSGVVVSRRGSGTYVQRRVTTTNAKPLTSIADMRRCLEFRVSFEGESAYHAAAGRAEDRDDLIVAVERLEQDRAGLRMEVNDDFAFHLAVARATGNRFFHDTMQGLRESIITAMGITPSFMQVRTPERLALLHAEHIAVFDAIMANDPEGARTAMRTHLNNAIRRVFDGVF